jgi:TonB family protein
MKTTLIITTLMIALASAFAETDVIPLPDATKRQMQKQAENAESKRQASNAKAKPEKVQDINEVKALATYAPRPQYPYEARARQITGRVVVGIRISPKTGNVTIAVLLHSSGNAILDNAALSAFRQWRFKPGTDAVVKIPVTFTMSGAYGT